MSSVSFFASFWRRPSFLANKKKKKKRRKKGKKRRRRRRENRCQRERAVCRDNGRHLWIQITVYRRLEFFIKKQRGRLRTGHGRCPMPGVNEHEITSVTLPCEKWRCPRPFSLPSPGSFLRFIGFTLLYLSPFLPTPFPFSSSFCFARRIVRKIWFLCRERERERERECVSRGKEQFRV